MNSFLLQTLQGFRSFILNLNTKGLWFHDGVEILDINLHHVLDSKIQRFKYIFSIGNCIKTFKNPFEVNTSSIKWQQLRNIS